MQYSVVNKSKLQSNIRIDAEFYSPEFLVLEKTLNSHQTAPFSTYSVFVRKGIFDLSPDHYTDQGIPLIRTSEIKDPQIDFSSTVFLNDKTHNINKKTELNPGDIVFTKIGAYIGDVAILPKKYNKYNFSQNVIGVKLNKDKIKPGFLLAFLLSKYGNPQVKRITMLSGQGKLELEDIKNIKIAFIGDKIESFVDDLVLKAEDLKGKSANIYCKSNQILLSELGLLNWKHKHHLTFVKNFSYTKSVVRLDAEYFQPIYEDIVGIIKKYKTGYKTLVDTVIIKDKNFTPKNDVIYKYIELSNISANGNITGFTQATGKELPSRARRKVSFGDVIVSSIEGSLSSIALITDELDGALCSTGFYVVKSNDINSETLLVLLKSPVGQLQLKKGCSGSILTAIGKDEFERIILPNINPKVQEEIKKKITEMYNAKVSSKYLLDIAKQAIEIAIEKNEDEAIKWAQIKTDKIHA